MATTNERFITTVRVRPARAKVLAECGISTGRQRELVEVTVCGETVGVVNSADCAVLWRDDTYSPRQIEQAAKAAFALMRAWKGTHGRALRAA